jgi:hypothetical protein
MIQEWSPELAKQIKFVHFIQFIGQYQTIMNEKMKWKSIKHVALLCVSMAESFPETATLSRAVFENLRINPGKYARGKSAIVKKFYFDCYKEFNDSIDARNEFYRNLQIQPGIHHLILDMSDLI